MRRGITALAVTTCVLVLVAGCRSTAPTEEVWNHAFTTNSAVISGEERPLASTLTLTFTADGVSARAGCNTMFGPVTLDGATLTTTSPLGMTMMACDPALMDQDQWIADFLSSRPAWKRDGANLILTSADTVLVLTDASSA